MPMQLKMDDKGAIALNEGKPIYVMEDGKEFVADVPAMHARISQLSRESREHRTKFDEASQRLSAFGDLDPEKAREALEKLSGLDLSKMGNVDKIREEVAKALETKHSAAVKGWETKFGDAEKKSKQLEGQLYDALIGGSFANSKYVTDKLAIPAAVARAYFGAHFRIENGRTVAYDTSGNQIYSLQNPGMPADFDEALSILVDRDPTRDALLRASGASGSGSSSSGDARSGSNDKQVTREEFDAMSNAERMKFSKSGGTVAD